MKKFYAQGDMVLEMVGKIEKGGVEPSKVIETDPDGSVVIGRGEVTGHRHRFALEDAVVMFRDDSLAKDVPNELYVGHVKITKPATLLHEEHGPIDVPPGMYRVRRQREWTAEHIRIVAD